MDNSNRRNFLKLSLGGVTGVIAGASVVSRALAQDRCVLTPKQTSGPFYPGEKEFGLDVDMTKIPGSNIRAKGQIIYITGRVLDQNCRPLEGANVEMWQACASGKYKSQKDPNPAPLDPNFKYWAETFTNAKGQYIFKTIIPGAYPADTGWTRPPHLHFKVTKLGYREIITQSYFKGNRLNDLDLILRNLPALERDSVIVDFKPSGREYEPGSLTGFFDLTLRSVR
jgi:protocatechuate 3,4-dioxygenase beta subunit